MPGLVATLLAIVALLSGSLRAERAVPLRLPRPLPARAFVVPILMYHRIGPEPHGPAITDALTVPPGVFAGEMDWLRRAGFHAIRQRELFAALEYGARLPRQPILITFDDGYRDVLWNAAPLLHRMHMPATTYVITGRVSGRDSSFLTWDELRQLEGIGFDIGSHTVHHVALTALPQALALKELVDSRLALERHLGRRVPWFAYPSGRENAGVVRLVRSAGYLMAATTAPGDLQRASHPLELRRYEVLDKTGVRGLRALLGR